MVSQKIIAHFLSLTLIIAALLTLHSPILLNADFFMQFDETGQAGFTIDLFRGGSVFFYYPSTSNFSYHGILHGLFAIPFFWLFGISALAYKLPAILFYAIHIWTTCWISGKINPRAPFLVGLLMLFCPPAMWFIATHNWSNAIILFLGNLSLVFFIECYSPRKNLPLNVFLLFTTLGLSIYAYTLSIIYAAAIALIFILTSPWWKEVRSNFKSSIILPISFWWKNLGSTKLRFIRVLDLIIISFLLATGFAYAWGGFAIDIGISSTYKIPIFQIKNFHKPVLQVLILIAVRLLMYRKDLPCIFEKTKTWARTIDDRTKTLVAYGFSGLIIGLSPRIVAIMTGETTRGGQGFDIRLDPFRLLKHLKVLVFERFPDLLGIQIPLKELFLSPNEDPLLSTVGILAVVILGLVAIASYSFFKIYSNAWGNIFKLRDCQFDPVLILIALPTMTCLANILIQNGPETVRYIYPIFAVAVVWVAIFLLRVRDRSLFAFIALTVLWVAFYSLNNYRFYRDSGAIRGLVPVEKKLDLKEVKQFLNSEGVELAFSSYWTALRAHLIDQGTVVTSYGSGFYLNALPEPDLTKIRSFAIITDEHPSQFTFHSGDKYAVKKTQPTIFKDGPRTIFYETLLKEKEIQYKKNRMGSYTIFWDFRGDRSRTEELWSILVRNISLLRKT